MLDKVAESFGQKCYEVPVGFKHISAKMQETDAIIGGESSGGLTVKGHIHGKDGIYAAALLVEMIAARYILRTAAGLLPDSLVRNRCFAYSVRWNMNRIQSGCAICLKNIWDCRNRPDRQEI